MSQGRAGGQAHAPRAQASVNLAAIERNCTRLRAELDDQGVLCAVVKADGYGHGAVQSARAALAGGARWLAVAGAQEACELRAAGLGEPPILVMGALREDELGAGLEADADVVVWSEAFLERVIRAGGGRVHVKLDSGMGRLGTRDGELASRLCELARVTPGVELVGLMTHFATADEADDDGFFARQLELFARWAGAEKARQPELIVHAANSAALLREPRARFDMVRCGIAVYGMDPFGLDPLAQALEPALTLSSYVAEVKRYRTGESAGYGRRFVADRDTWLGVLPIGYGDGWRRGLSNNAEALIGGVRRALVGTVSMDNVTIELGSGQEARADSQAGADPQQMRGSPALLIGRDGAQRITAEQVAARLQTINYEITCGLTPRVPRVYHHDGVALDGAPWLPADHG